MRRILLILLAACLVLSLVSCGKKDPNAKGTVLFGGDNDYRIVYSANATMELKDMVLSISEAVKNATGVEAKLVADSSKKETEVAHEILIGTTNRAQSEEGMEKLSEVGYRVEFIDEKLVISASNDIALEKAVEALMNGWTAADGVIKLSRKAVFAEDMSDGVRPICENGELLYSIIIQASASDAIYSAAEELSSRLTVLVGKKVTVSYDTMVKSDDSAYEICIGKTNRAISESLYGEIETLFDYKIRLDGNKIAVAATGEEALEKAISVLTEDLCAAISSTYRGEPTIAKDYAVSARTADAIENFSEPKSGTLGKMVTTGEDNERVLYYKNIAEADYRDYVALLGTLGCTVVNTYTLGDNQYTLMKNDGYGVYVGYIPAQRCMRIVLDNTDDLYPASAAPEVKSVCTPALWQLELDCTAASANGGMSYVIRLTDGTFVIIDGGYRSDATALYKHLKENTVGGGKPVVSAWVITHLHNDHYGALKGIASDFRDRVDVKAFYYNFPGIQCGDVGLSNKNDIERTMRQWPNAVLYNKLHSGMSFSVVDAKFTVICTYEDVFPQEIDNGNDTTTVLKAEIGGQSIMFLGDAYYKQSAVMTSQIDAAVLKSDIVQISHHGYEGCSAALYGMVNPTVALWPMPIVGFKGNAVFKEWYEGKHNTYIKNSADVKKILVSGAGTAMLDFPYTPTGERIVDYEAYYQTHK